MLFDKTTFIGIDPTAGQKPFIFAALDADLQLLALGQGKMDEVLAFVGGQQTALIGVNAPQRPNQGLMSAPEVRQLLEPPPPPGRWTGFRVAEYQLHVRGISVPRTPDKEAECTNWVQTGFQLYRRLAQLNYVPFPGDDAPHRFLEVYPHGAYTVLLERVPFPKNRLEGRVQRQLVLYLNQVSLPNPMRIFEEITRHRILQGILPLDGLHTPEELDALVAAYTAWMVANRPESVTLVGDAREGQIALPASELKSHYS